MIKALLLIFDPMATWEGIFRARRSLAFILVMYLLPLLLLASAAEGYGLVHWGKWQGEVGRAPSSSPVREAVVVETGQFLLSLVVVFVGANMIKSIGETFHGRHTYTQAFTTVAYGLSPLFLLPPAGRVHRGIPLGELVHRHHPVHCRALSWRAADDGARPRRMPSGSSS